MSTASPHLKHLFGAYFHQDWREEASSHVDAVKNFMQGEPPDVVRGATLDLFALLSSTMTDDELRDLIVVGFGSSCDPTLVGTSMRSWLRELHGVLSTR